MTSLNFLLLDLKYYFIGVTLAPYLKLGISKGCTSLFHHMLVPKHSRVYLRIVRRDPDIVGWDTLSLIHFSVNVASNDSLGIAVSAFVLEL